MQVFTYDEETFSELYKEVNGFRPRTHQFYTVAPEEKQRIWDSLLVDLDFVNKQEIEMQKESIRSFENLILETISLGAENRESALKWIIDGQFDEFDQMYIEGDSKYFNHEFGLPYGYDWKSGNFLKGSYNTFTGKAA